MIEEYGDKNTAAAILMFEESKLSEGKLLLWEHDESPSNIQANADNLVKKQTSSATCRTSIMSSCDFPEEEEVEESNELDSALVKSDDANDLHAKNDGKPDDDVEEEEANVHNHTRDLMVDLLAETDEGTNGFHAEEQSRIRSGSPIEEESKNVEIHVGKELSIRSDIQAKQQQSAEVHVKAEQNIKLQLQEEKELKNTGNMASAKKDNNNDVLIEEADAETKCIDDDKHENERSTKVSFSTIEIREYPMIIGVNPAVSCGVPLTIDWTHVDLYEFSVEEYEKHKPSSRSLVELRMPMMMRDSVCRRLNFTRRHIMEGIKAANVGRNRRKRTLETMQLAHIEEGLERVRRATVNVTVGRAAKKQEREYMTACSLPSKTKHWQVVRITSSSSLCKDDDHLIHDASHHQKALSFRWRCRKLGASH